ncbi:MULTISPECIES: methylmalonyl-CoA mutase family protein [unclassified Sinorhizobium]|uniref:methylmalonyl-CoA mutase family protein n=1 Tax=unclassified Sinorhizobium TaxID=2613772 RepID=UPI003524DB67
MMDASVLKAVAFPTADRDLWLKLVEKALKGADIEQTLTSRTDDGLKVEPLYPRRANAAPIPRRAPEKPWAVTQRMDDPDQQRAESQMADDLANGANGISLVFRDSPSAFGLGMETIREDVFSALVGAGAEKSFSIRLEGGAQGGQAAKILAEALEANGAACPHFGIDPLGTRAYGATAADLTTLAHTFKDLLPSRLEGTILNADGRPVHNAGGTEAQELAFMAAALAEYLRLLDQANVSCDAVLAATGLCLAADQDQFLTMAKARAARLIFARMAEACGIDAAIKAHLFMETSHRMLTRLDPETNLLRNTIAVFAAGTGGADEISVLPHTLVHGIPDAAARRLARNTQTILIAESHLDHVADPAAGAGGIETLTDDLAEKAWEIFTDIERAGGLAKAISDGRIRSMVAEARRNRPDRPIVGTALFPMKAERPVAVLGELRPIADHVCLRPIRLAEENRG